MQWRSFFENGVQAASARLVEHELEKRDLGQVPKSAGAGFAGSDELFLERFEFDGAHVFDFELEFAAPVDERAARDIELLSDTGEGGSLAVASERLQQSFPSTGKLAVTSE